MDFNIPKTDRKRVVIVGGGFAGIETAKKLKKAGFQIVLLDKQNYHTFPPLLYQVATASLESGSIAFPFRRLFQKYEDFHIRVAEVTGVDFQNRLVHTDCEAIGYDYLVLATGTTTNFRGNTNVENNALAMKTVEEALLLRNAILSNFEKALDVADKTERQKLLNIVVVGGGPTGVEIAGALAEMKRFELYKDYPDLDISDTNIILVEGEDRLLATMSKEASENAARMLRKMGVVLMLSTRAEDYKNDLVYLDKGEPIPTKTMIYVSGVTGATLDGIGKDFLERGNRIKVNSYNQVEGYDDVFALGDIAFMGLEDYPKGHPQLAQVAIQQGRLLGKNLPKIDRGEKPEPFDYWDKGTMATVGRNKAVADIKKNSPARHSGMVHLGIYPHYLHPRGQE